MVVLSHEHLALVLSYLVSGLQVPIEHDPIWEHSLHVSGCAQSFCLPPGAVLTQQAAGSGGCILRRPYGGGSKGVQRKPILTYSRGLQKMGERLRAQPQKDRPL